MCKCTPENRTPCCGGYTCCPNAVRGIGCIWCRPEQRREPELAIKVVKNKEGDWGVRIGEKYDEHLGRGEALEVVAMALFTGDIHPYLRTESKWKDWQAHLGRISKKGDKG